MFGNPFAEKFPRGVFVSIVIIASKQKYLEIWGIPQARNLVSTFLLGRRGFRGRTDGRIHGTRRLGALDTSKVV